MFIYMKIVASLEENGEIKREAIFNGTIYTYGSLILQGIDVNAELEKNKEAIQNLIKKCNDIEAYLKYISDNFQLNSDEKTIIEKSLEKVKSGAEISGIVSFLLAGLTPGNIAIAFFVLAHNLYKNNKERK